MGCVSCGVRFEWTWQEIGRNTQCYIRISCWTYIRTYLLNNKQRIFPTVAIVILVRIYYISTMHRSPLRMRKDFEGLDGTPSTCIVWSCVVLCCDVMCCFVLCLLFYDVLCCVVMYCIIQQKITKIQLTNIAVYFVQRHTYIPIPRGCLPVNLW